MATTTFGAAPCVLLDSNIFIAAEDHSTDAGDLDGPEAAELLRLVSKLHYGLLLSHGTRSDVMAADPARRERRERALAKYVVLEAVPTNASLRAQFPVALSDNDAADLEVASAFATGRATWLVTQDKKLRGRATAAGFDNVLSLSDAVEMLQALAGEPILLTAPEARHVEAYTISTDAAMFDGLRADYADFDDWWRSNVVRLERPVIVLGDDAEPSGMAVLKEEDDCPYGLPDRVLKICTFKVSEVHQGVKRGEALLRACIEHARAGGHHTVYLEVLPDKVDLIEWLDRFGFHQVDRAEGPGGQLVFAKRLEPAVNDEPLDPLRHAIEYGPGNLYVERAHIVPIQSRYHQLLFPDADTQGQDSALFGGTYGCGNAIRKAYLCHAPSRKVQEGHGLAFAKTGDGTARLTAVGIVESVLVSRDPKELASAVGTRTVYSQDDIERMCAEGDVLALLFRHDRALADPITIIEMAKAGVLKRTPQSIAELSLEGLTWLLPRLAA